MKSVRSVERKLRDCWYVLGVNLGRRRVVEAHQSFEAVYCGCRKVSLSVMMMGVMRLGGGHLDMSLICKRLGAIMYVFHLGVHG
jgi:hypothetical protein